MFTPINHNKTWHELINDESGNLNQTSIAINWQFFINSFQPPIHDAEQQAECHGNVRPSFDGFGIVKKWVEWSWEGMEVEYVTAHRVKSNRRNQRPDLSDIIWKFCCSAPIFILIPLESQFRFYSKCFEIFTLAQSFNLQSRSYILSIFMKKSLASRSQIQLSDSHRHCIDTGRFRSFMKALQRRLVEPSSPESVCVGVCWYIQKGDTF